MRRYQPAFSALLCIGAFAAMQIPSASAAPKIEDLLQKTGSFVEMYWQQLSLFTCTETVAQEKLGKEGKLEYRQNSTFDYLVLPKEQEEGLTIEEVRLPVKLPHKKPNRPPLLNTNGFPTLLLVFHPFYRAYYRYEVDSENEGNGRLVRIRFEHIPGMRSTSALLLQDRIYDLDLQGTALVDAATGAILKINAGLAAPMKQINIESLNLEVIYTPQALSQDLDERLLPASADIEVRTALQHWRNIHRFSNYKRFTVRSEEASSR